ncbi:hypothetical protein PENSPDRAFT_659654 [Peniophora sp. CONT]|nr:hypothetical protein PENSPDRAFT_659654 [Peniophora sp. CONT]
MTTISMLATLRIFSTLSFYYLLPLVGYAPFVTRSLNGCPACAMRNLPSRVSLITNSMAAPATWFIYRRVFDQESESFSVQCVLTDPTKCEMRDRLLAVGQNLALQALYAADVPTSFPRPDFIAI